MSDGGPKSDDRPPRAMDPRPNFAAMTPADLIASTHRSAVCLTCLAACLYLSGSWSCWAVLLQAHSRNDMLASTAPFHR